eukprot:g250.t1
MPLLLNKVCLVTGATSGIGYQTAVSVVEEGGCVFATGRNESALKKLEDGIPSDKIFTRVADCRIESQVKEVVQDCVAKFGRIDVLVNSAGVIKGAATDAADLKNLDDHYAVNVRGLFAFMIHSIPHLKKTKGNIVNVSSVNGQQSFAGCMSYCASKASVDMITKCAAVDLAKYQVRVNSVNPGVTRTELHRRGGKTEKEYGDFLEKCKKTHPIGRIAEPREIADAIMFLASEKAGAITGTILLVDGGRSCLGAR